MKKILLPVVLLLAAHAAPASASMSQERMLLLSAPVAAKAFQPRCGRPAVTLRADDALRLAHPGVQPAADASMPGCAIRVAAWDGTLYGFCIVLAHEYGHLSMTGTDADHSADRRDVMAPAADTDLIEFAPCRALAARHDPMPCRVGHGRRARALLATVARCRSLRARARLSARRRHARARHGR